jgi:hypothetical protein
MSITSQVQKDIVASMKARQALDEREEMQVLSTLVKQRHEASEAFTKGNRPELAAKELAEIVFIESYLPKAVGSAEIAAAVQSVLAEMGAPTAKEMGTIMKHVMAKFGDARVDGKQVSEAVKKALAG